MRNFILKKIPLLLALLGCSIMFGQSVSGIISDSSGPLPGANVFIKNTNNGTTTNFDGQYELQNVPADGVLVISFLGYITQEIAVSGKSSISLTLQEDADALEEVVVVGYSTKSTRDITGSIEVVDVENLQKTAPLSVEQALQGQASGVTVGAQGGPGGGAAVRIRGFSSLNGADPLYVIDGTPTGAGLNDLNPADIESIQVLKDASSTAIYGNRAANGVIIITTKKGKRNNKVNFNVTSWTGVDYVPSSVFPDLASPQQIADALWQAQANTANLNPDVTMTTPSTDLYGSGASPILPNYIIPAGAETADLSTYSLANPISLANKNGTDWFGAFFNPALVHNTNISMSGGTDKSNYYVGLGVLDQNGVGKETYYNRYNARINSDFSVTDKFKIGQSLNLSYSEQVAYPRDGEDDGSLDNSIISLLRMHPIIPIYDVNGGFSGSLGSDLTGNGLNPIATAINNRDNKAINVRALGNFYAQYEILKNLTLKTNLGYDITSFEKRTFNPSRLFDANPNLSNSLQEEVRNTYNYNWFNTANYDATLGKHNLNVLAGTELVKTRSKYFNIFGSDFEFENDIDSQFIDLSRDQVNADGRASKTALFSLLSKVSYKFDDRYLLDATVRRDASSKFGAIDSDLRSAWFYSFSAGWRISSESFLRDSEAITNLLLKGGYGEIGNDGIPEALDQTTTESNIEFDSYSFGGVTANGSSIFATGNRSIFWETKKTTNVGLDLTLFNRFDFSFEYFDTTSEDLLTLIATDPTVNGETNVIPANAGQLSNNGFDINVAYRSNSSSEFQYNIGANISAYKNEIDFLDPNNNVAQIFGTDYAFHGPANVTQEGSPIGSFYGLNYLGVDADGAAIFEDPDGDSETDNRQIIGNPHPDFTYGVNFNANYKNFDLSLFFQGSQGNDIYNLTRYITETSQFPGAKSIDYVNAATPGNGGDIPLLRTDEDALASSGATSLFVEDGSYIKLKNIQLGYSLPSSFLDKMNIERFRIYLQAKNLFTITNYSGLDPEISVRSFSNNQAANDIRSNNTRSLGVDSGSYPISRSVIMGVNVSL